MQNTEGSKIWMILLHPILHVLKQLDSDSAEYADSEQARSLSPRIFTCILNHCASVALNDIRSCSAILNYGRFTQVCH